MFENSLTRRLLAIMVVTFGVAGCLYLIIFGAMSGNRDLMMLGAGTLFGWTAMVIGFYFGVRAKSM